MCVSKGEPMGGRPADCVHNTPPLLSPNDEAASMDKGPSAG